MAKSDQTVAPDQTDETVADQGNTAPENSEQASTENAAPEFDRATLDEFGQQFLDRAVSQVTARNEIATKVKSMSADPTEIGQALYDSLKAGTYVEVDGVTDADVAAYNEAEKIVQDYLDKFRKSAEETGKKKATENVDEATLTALTTELETIDKKVKNARSMLALEYPGAESLLPELVRIKGGSSSGGGTGKGAGGKKLRGFTVTVDGNLATLKNSKGEMTSSFAAAASVLGIPTADLQGIYFAAVGGSDQEKFPTTPVEMSVTGADEKIHAVVATKQSA